MKQRKNKGEKMDKIRKIRMKIIEYRVHKNLYLNRELQFKSMAKWHKLNNKLKNKYIYE